jgi:Stage II sporulation protein E (SpoIIE)
MSGEETTNLRRPSLAALPELLEVLSPLESISDRVGLAKAVTGWVAATVAADCLVHLVEDGQPKELFVRSWTGPGPEVSVLQGVVASSAMAVAPAPSPQQAWVVLPLSVGGRAFGALSMLIDSAPEEIGRHHLQGLGRVASALAQAIGEARMNKRANQVSQALQASLLPGALAEGDWFELAARYVPGTADLRIGGDWYDSQVMPDGTVALSVGDIAGHGVEAALQMGELRSAMSALRLVRSAPDELISVVHRLAADMDYFATVTCVRLDPTGNLQWASAGHLPPLVVRDDGTARLLSTNQTPPLGVGYAGKVPLNRYRLNPEDTVVIYTDGLVERRDQAIHESLEMLSARAAQLTNMRLKEVVDSLVASRDYSGSTGDDVAVLAARWQLSPGATTMLT